MNSGATRLLSQYMLFKKIYSVSDQNDRRKYWKKINCSIYFVTDYRTSTMHCAQEIVKRVNKQTATRDPHQVNDLFAFLINVLLIATSALQKHLHGISVDDHSDIDGANFCDRASQLLLRVLLIIATSLLQIPCSSRLCRWSWQHRWSQCLRSCKSMASLHSLLKYWRSRVSKPPGWGIFSAENFPGQHGHPWWQPRPW